MPSGAEVPSPAGSGYLLGMPSGSEVHSPAGSGYLLGMPSGSEVPSRAISNPTVNYWGYQHQNSFYNYPTSTHSVATGYEVKTLSYNTYYDYRGVSGYLKLGGQVVM